MIILSQYKQECKHGIIRISAQERVNCPVCNGKLHVRGTCERKVRSESGVTVFHLLVMECEGCGRTHREIPDCIIPYKRNSLKNVCEIVESTAENHTCETSTWIRLKEWIRLFLWYAHKVMEALKQQYDDLVTDCDGKTLYEQTAYHVRAVVNSGNWVTASFRRD